MVLKLSYAVLIVKDLLQVSDMVAKDLTTLYLIHGTNAHYKYSSTAIKVVINKGQTQYILLINTDQDYVQMQ